MKKITLFFSLLLIGSTAINAQTDINFDAGTTEGSPDAGWLTFMNVSNLPAPDGDGAFQFGSAWGIPDLVAELDVPGNTVTLKPNRIGDPNIYWQGDQLSNPTPRGNKIMDANLYVQDDGLNGTSFTFNGSVVANTLNNTGIAPYDFTVTAFIKVFASDFSSVLDSDVIDLRTTSGDWTLSMDATGYTSGENIQYGFQFIGPNIAITDDQTTGNPAWDAEYAAMGSIVVGANSTLSTIEVERTEFAVFPNPSKDNWSVRSTSNINSITVYDALGQRVSVQSPDSLEATIDGGQLQTGMYFARIQGENGSDTIRLIKE